MKRQTATIRDAAEYMFEHPGVAFAEVARHIGINRTTFWEWRQTEDWEKTFRQVGADHAPQLVPAAISALLKSWAKGNPAGAIETLRSYGLLSPEKVNLEHSISEAELDREIERFLARLAPTQEAAPTPATNGVAPNGASGPPELR